MYAHNLFAINVVLAAAGLTGLSGAATTFSTGVTIPYALQGKAYSKAAFAAAATPTADFVTGLPIALKANTGTVVMWCLDSAGNARCVQGTVEQLDESGNFIQSPQFPGLPNTLAPFAYSVHKAGSTTVGTWTFGVSNWNATGLTHTVQNIIVPPARPQIA